MRFVANGLARAGYTVHCPTLAGHCGTEHDIANATWQEWYASAEAALLEMRKTCSTVIVGGLSTGAVLSLLLAARHPDKVQGLTLLAPTLKLNGWSMPWYTPLLNLARTKWFANKFLKFQDTDPHGIKDERIRKFFRDALFSGDTSGTGFVHTPGGAVLEHRWLVQELRKVMGTIEQPTLILHPREDDIADMSNAWELQRKLKGMVEMVVLHDSYHNVTIDRQRHVVVERTAGFVERLVAQLAKSPKAPVQLRAA
jgi:carboxylesterase